MKASAIFLQALLSLVYAAPVTRDSESEDGTAVVTGADGSFVLHQNGDEHKALRRRAADEINQGLYQARPNAKLSNQESNNVESLQQGYTQELPQYPYGPAPGSAGDSQAQPGFGGQERYPYGPYNPPYGGDAYNGVNQGEPEGPNQAPFGYQGQPEFPGQSRYGAAYPTPYGRPPVNPYGAPPAGPYGPPPSPPSPGFEPYGAPPAPGPYGGYPPPPPPAPQPPAASGSPASTPTPAPAAPTDPVDPVQSPESPLTAPQYWPYAPPPQSNYYSPNVSPYAAGYSPQAGYPYSYYDGGYYGGAQGGNYVYGCDSSGNCGFSGGSGCYAEVGNTLATESGKCLRYLLCPWSWFADKCDESGSSGFSCGQSGAYYQPQYPVYPSPPSPRVQLPPPVCPQYVPQPIPEPIRQAPVVPPRQIPIPMPPISQPQPQYFPPPMAPQCGPAYAPPQYSASGGCSGGSGCYAEVGNELASESGRLLRYFLCPWSFFADKCEEKGSGKGCGPSYPAPYQYAPYGYGY